MARKTKIKLPRSLTPGVVPTTADLDEGEIGLNTSDAKAYIKTVSNAIRQLGLVQDDPSPQLSANLNANDFYIQNLLDPVLDQDAVTKFYVDQLDAATAGKVAFDGDVTTFVSSIDVLDAFDPLLNSDIYRITFSGFFTDDAAVQDLYLRFSDDNLTTEIATGYEMQAAEGGGNVTALSNTTELFLGRLVPGTSSPLSGSVTIFNPQKSVNKSAFVQAISNVGGGQPVRYYNFGLVMNNTNIFDSFRFFASAGLIKGTFTGYEVRTAII